MSRLALHLTRALAFLAAAGVMAAIANRFAPPSRKLDWLGQVPAVSLVPEAAAAPETAPDAKPEVTPEPATSTVPPAKSPAPAPQPAPRTLDPFQPSSTAVVRQIGSDDAWAAYRRRIPFVDARRTADFEEGHVAGAWSAPVWESDCDRRITEFEARANPGMKDPIVLYCAAGCEDSKLLAAKLQGLGYRNLLVYNEGFPDWTAKARPVARGARP